MMKDKGKGRDSEWIGLDRFLKMKRYPGWEGRVTIGDRSQNEKMG
jgi:hypothetical protein